MSVEITATEQAKVESCFMVPSSNWLGGQPFTLEIGVRTSVESPSRFARQKHHHMSSGKSVRVSLIRQTIAWGRVAHESLARVLSDASRKLELCSTKRFLTGHSIKRRSIWGGIP